MPRHLRWRDLRVGIAASLAIAAVTLAILVFARVGRLPGDTYRIHVRAQEARGLISGSDVWLNGQKIGVVRKIAFLPPSSASTARVVLTAEVLERHREALRADTRVEIKSGGSLIGAPVVYLSLGTAPAPVLRPGDTLIARDQVDLEAVAAKYADASQHLPAILSDVKTVLTLMKSPDGTLGAFAEERGGAEAAAVRERMGAMASHIRNDRGTVGLALHGRAALMGRARTAMARADSIRRLVASQETSLGRFRRDTSLVAAIADIRNELTIVRALLAEPRGTLGRAVLDSAIVRGLGEAEREMSALFADMKRRPLRYLPF